MTIGGIGSQIDNLQVIRAQRAFEKRNCEAQKELKQPESPGEAIDKTIPPGFSGNDNKGIQEIKNFANQYNLPGIEEDDIHHALKYGTSLFADYSA